MSKAGFGRGNIAPYSSTHIRVPEPIKPQLEAIVNKYKEAVLNGKDFSFKYPLSKVELINLSKDILRQKKSARISLTKLLTVLLDEEIKPEELAH